KKIMYILNTHLTDKIHGNFVTGVYAVLDLDNPSIDYSTAGHPPIFHYRKKHHDIMEINTSNMVLGVFENNHFQEEQVKLQKGDRLLFYTDGIYEAFDKDHNLFGFDRLKELFLETHSMDIELVPDIFLERVKDFSSDNGIEDDVVLIAIEVLGE
ncbi:MAG TPA: serine/threonine-protein phosphatase, partial [Spirochaetes bacterium]|nr:serine/threonine-protein phosphatase [Spirochaetota bacterium]